MASTATAPNLPAGVFINDCCAAVSLQITNNINK